MASHGVGRGLPEVRQLGHLVSAHFLRIAAPRVERATLGQVAHQLRDRGLRPDFLALLESVVGYRNRIAHSLLADQIILQSLGAGDARFERRELEKGIYELEQLWFLFKWTEAHAAWG